MSDDVRSAAERLLEDLQNKQWANEPFGRDTAIVVNDWLAKNLADDDEPVTEEWIRSIGFVKDNDGYSTSFACNWLLFRFKANRVVCNIESDTSNDLVRIDAPDTRGEARRLFSALGCRLVPRGNVPQTRSGEETC